MAFYFNFSENKVVFFFFFLVMEKVFFRVQLFQAIKFKKDRKHTKHFAISTVLKGFKTQ